MGSNSNRGCQSSGLMEAINLQSNGHFQQAAHVFRQEGNRERPIAEKEALWKAAERAMEIHNSD